MKGLVTAKQQPVPNALQHGILSKHLLLQSENPEEYTELLESLVQEYAPEGVTEQHLVEELAGIIWRKRRLKIAEAAHYRNELLKRHDSYSNCTAKAAMIYTNTEAKIDKFNLKKALACADLENQNELNEIKEYRDPTIKALALLENGGNYEEALAVIADGTREWWELEKLGEERYNNVVCKPCAEHLEHFLRLEALPYYNQEHADVIYRPVVKQQAEGEAFIPNDNLEKFSRYEVHLDRKFERTLTVLIRLSEIRKNTVKDNPIDEIT